MRTQIYAIARNLGLTKKDVNGILSDSSSTSLYKAGTYYGTVSPKEVYKAGTYYGTVSSTDVYKAGTYYGTISPRDF